MDSLKVTCPVAPLVTVVVQEEASNRLRGVLSDDIRDLAIDLVDAMARSDS